MEVVVADDQLSLAIGKKGQNVRLASKLTGWKIDIKSESRMEKISGEILEKFSGLPYIGDVASRILYNEGFRSIKELAEVDPEELAKVLGIEKEKAVEIVEGAVEISKKEEGKGATQETVLTAADPSSDPVDRLEGVGEKTTQLLGENGLKTVHDILETNIEKLSAIPGIGIKKAEKLIQSAKQYIEGKKA
jgi:N utilization substance protein A